MSVLATIPVTNHHNLSRPLAGHIVALHSHGPDIEVVLEGRQSFSILFDEAQQLRGAGGSNLRDLLAIYDGHRVVGRED